jgi:hypothetical protein
MTIEIIKGHNNQVADFFSSPSSTPETDAETMRGELLGVIKSLRKNAKEDADRIDKLEQALSYGSGGKTLLSKFLNAVKQRNEFMESAKLLVKQLVLQIERPAYTVDEAVDKMFLMESAKKFINEMS